MVGVKEEDRSYKQAFTINVVKSRPKPSNIFEDKTSVPLWETTEESGEISNHHTDSVSEDGLAERIDNDEYTTNKEIYMNTSILLAELR